MTREDYYLTMSQCSSVEFCKGYNEAIDKIFDELEAQLKQAYIDGSNSNNELIKSLHKQIKLKNAHI